MAIYHLSVKSVSRAGGRSATASAAYRSASRVADRSTGQVFDYTRKSGVEHAEIVMPTEAAKRDITWPRDRERLWNAAEEAERRKDARVAREYEIALPTSSRAFSGRSWCASSARRSRTATGWRSTSRSTTRTARATIGTTTRT